MENYIRWENKNKGKTNMSFNKVEKLSIFNLSNRKFHQFQWFFFYYPPLNQIQSSRQLSNQAYDEHWEHLYAIRNAYGMERHPHQAKHEKAYE